MKLSAIAAASAFIVAGGAAWAQAGPAPMPECTTSCNSSNQHMGDTSSQADNSQSQATQSNPSSNSNVSGNDVTINPSIQQSGNTVDQSGSHQSATGGNANATGNTSSNNNQSSASNNATNLGGSVGNTSSNSGGNILGNDSSNSNSNSNHNNVAGGAGGAGGHGGAANVQSSQSIGDTRASADHSGDTVAGAAAGVLGSGNSDVAVDNTDNSDRSNANANLQGQQQGIADAGNSDNTNVMGQANRGGDQANAQGQESTNVLGQANRGGDQSVATSTGQGQDQSADNDNRVEIDNSDKSQRSVNVDARSLYIPAVTPPTPSSVVGVGQIVHDVSACGPLHSVARVPVKGHFFGFFASTEFDASYDDVLMPYFDADGQRQMYREVRMPDGSVRFEGHQVVSDTAILGTAAARNMALGGGGSNMSWGQAGGGASSSVQAMVTHINLRSCEVQAVPSINLPVIQGVRQ